MLYVRLSWAALGVLAQLVVGPSVLRADILQADCPADISLFNVRVVVELSPAPANICQGGRNYVGYWVEWDDPFPGQGGGFIVRGRFAKPCPINGCAWSAAVGSTTRFLFGSQEPICPPVGSTMRDIVGGWFNDLTVEKVGVGSSIPCTPNKCAVMPNCGDGVVDPLEEECDDGNPTDGDGCSCCKSDCGNGTVEPATGEQCDDGNRNSGDCCVDCLLPPMAGTFDNSSPFTRPLMGFFSTCPLGFSFPKISDGSGLVLAPHCVEGRIHLKAYRDPNTPLLDRPVCLYGGGGNAGYALFSPSPGYNCITEIRWFNLESRTQAMDECSADSFEFDRYNVFTIQPPGSSIKVRREHCSSPDHRGTTHPDSCFVVDDSVSPYVKCPTRDGGRQGNGLGGTAAPAIEVMGPLPFEVCDGDLDGDCDQADRASIVPSLGACDGDTRYFSQVDVDGDGCIGAADIALFSHTFSDCSDGNDNDGDGAVDFQYDTGCATPEDASEFAFNREHQIIQVVLAEDSQDASSHPLNDDVWTAGIPPLPFDETTGIGNLVRNSFGAGEFGSFTLHDHMYVSPNVPSPERPMVIYEFEHPQTITGVEVLQHANGITQIEGFVGDSWTSLESIGSVFGPRGDVVGGRAFSEGESYTFQFAQARLGRVFAFIIRKTSAADGYAIYRAFPLDGSSRRLGASLAQCNDGIDNDGDGSTDYPSDNSCIGDYDDTEDGEPEATPTVTSTLPPPPTATPTLAAALLTAKKIVLKDNANAAKRKLVVLSNDPALSALDDPVTTPGARLRVRTASGCAGPCDTTYELSGTWAYLGKPASGAGFKYSDPVGPIRLIKFKPGKVLKIVGAGALGHALSANPAPVQVVLEIGGAAYCMEFADASTFIPGKTFKGSGTTAPAACPL